MNKEKEMIKSGYGGKGEVEVDGEGERWIGAREAKKLVK